jgi:hypothetical protein
MSFKPSAYSDAATDVSADPWVVGTQAASSVLTAATPLIQQSIAAAHKKKKKKKVTVTPTLMPIPAPVVAPAANPIDWKKYALWGVGIAAVGAITYYVLKKPEAEDAPLRKNPTRRALDFLIGRLESEGEKGEKAGKKRIGKRRNPEIEDAGSKVDRVIEEVSESDHDLEPDEDYDV